MFSQQYLIDCQDSSLCIIFERSIIFEGNWKKLGVGDEISFYWPEDSDSPETYKGSIVATSTNENELLNLMKVELKKRKNAAKKQKTNAKKQVKVQKSRIKVSCEGEEQKLPNNSLDFDVVTERFQKLLLDFDSTIPAQKAVHASLKSIEKKVNSLYDTLMTIQSTRNSDKRSGLCSIQPIQNSKVSVATSSNRSESPIPPWNNDENDFVEEITRQEHSEQPKRSIDSLAVRDKDGIWTLKYFKDDKGKNQELLPDCGIYISKYVLSNILSCAKKQTDLARALLTNLFTEDALHICSLTGKAAKGTGKGGPLRPGFNKGAREAMMSFIRQYAQKKGWAKMDDQTVSTSLRNKLSEIHQTVKLNEAVNIIV